MPKRSREEYRLVIEDAVNKGKTNPKSLEVFDFITEYGLRATHFSNLLDITLSGFQKKMNGTSSFTKRELENMKLEMSYIKNSFKPVEETVKGCYSHDFNGEYYVNRRKNLKN